jgi:hypothetical protein
MLTARRPHRSYHLPVLPTGRDDVGAVLREHLRRSGCVGLMYAARTD